MMMRAFAVALLASSAAAAPSAVVVGAGVGGLYTAARLAKSGVAVTQACRMGQTEGLRSLAV